MRTRLRSCLGALLVVSVAAPLWGQDLATVTVPAVVAFYVTDIGRSTPAAAPSTFEYLFAGAVVGSRALAVSIRAESPAFSGPAGGSIAAERVSWATSHVAGGEGYAGTLSDVVFARVYEGGPGVTEGSVAVAWTLAPLPPPVRAGDFALTLRWKIEVITP